MRFDSEFGLFASIHSRPLQQFVVALTQQVGLQCLANRYLVQERVSSLQSIPTEIVPDFTTACSRICKMRSA